ncbi:MAG: NAD(P)H-dependent oxidoreductase subunit E [Deltaproteobacteria bacterium]|nr:NAD(P)H-dependent oxidoreductase subunit E [Deltaproteobacteria bacterium]
MEPQSIERLIEENAQAPAALIAILQAIQREHGYLSAAALREVSRATGRPLVDVYGVATFYRAFSLHPRGKHVVSACLGTACHVRGAHAVVGEIERQLGIRAGGTTEDREFSLETVNCLGACALGPVVVIDGHYVSKVGKEKVRPLLDDARRGRVGGRNDGEATSLSLVAHCSHCRASLMDPDHPFDGLPSIRLAMKGPGATGWWRISSRYGSNKRETNSTAPRGTVLSVYCTHCGEDLSDGWKCPACRAPLVSLGVGELARLRVCPRLGCDGHMLDVAS